MTSDRYWSFEGSLDFRLRLLTSEGEKSNIGKKKEFNMLTVEYQGSPRDEVLFWIKPLGCPIGKPFCVVRWNLEQGINTCQFYCGVRRTRYGISYVKCTYDEVVIRNRTSDIPKCPKCTNYYGDICILYGEFRDPCFDFVDLLKELGINIDE